MAKPKAKSKPKAKAKATSDKRTKAKKPARGASPRVAPKQPKPRKAPARKRLGAEEVDRRLELARGAARKRREANKGIQAQLSRALEVIQDAARLRGYASTLQIKFPPRTHEGAWKTPWSVVGAFVFRGAGYREIAAVLDTWTTGRLVRRIGAYRMSRIRVDYVTATGQRGDYGLAETGPWEFVLARAREKVDPLDDRSLAVRYPTSKIGRLFVWLSEDIGEFIGRR